MTIEHAGAFYTPFPSFQDWFVGNFDTAVVDRYSELLAGSKLAASPEQTSMAVKVATRYAAVDTGAIEGLYSVDRGFTRTIATQAAAWEATLSARGERVAEAISDALDAYEYVLDAVTHSVPISEIWLKELHTLVCASQTSYTVYTQLGPEERPLPKGEYKAFPNSPTNAATGEVHAYAPVADTVPEMARLVAELRSETFAAAHPVLQAAYAHYAYVCVHPFADGNGRVARALASVYLYRRPGVPLVIFADQRSEYLDALERADKGDASLLITFIEQRTVDAVGIVRATLARSLVPINESLAALTAFFTASGVNPELLAAAERLRGMVRDEYRRQLGALALPPQLEISALTTTVGADTINPPPGYASIGSSGEAMLWARSSWPKAIQVRRALQVLIAVDSSASSDLLCVPNEGESLEVWLREIVPSQTQGLKLRVTNWTELQIAGLLAAVRVAALGGPPA